MNLFQDAFISYGRADSRAFAAKLHRRLVSAGLTVWFDYEDIPLGVDYQKQIDDAIHKADNFLFIISPHSVNSSYCLLEVERAVKYNKRIIPLLHVEEISWETWQQRNPESTEADWKTYKTEGKHSHFPNMHPQISKINWIYTRENLDDFEKSFQDLLELLDRQKDYVHRHTVLLNQALEWKHNQKQTRYLLIGEERQQAKDWLKIRFKDQQAPCLPADLHCEYISESIKNADNLMTQVFVAHAEEDADVTDKICRSLQRHGLTVWSSRTDIQTGEDFRQAINQGIEQADNIVYLLSPNAQQSVYCQQDLDYALSLNKRIIPILVSLVKPEAIPLGLRTVQYIDLTDNVEEADYLLDESQLLKILQQDAVYFNEHKVLLAAALKWERQHRNPSMLLRGYNLRQAETWLKLAEGRSQFSSTTLQKEFIQESLRQPPTSSLDVFISYSRSDADIARKLNEALQVQGKTTWFDQESIASGADFQQEIYRGIEIADHFLFILSPRSVKSPYCADEVEYAAKLNKRFVTVLYRPVSVADLHPQLAKVQWIDFGANNKDFAANFKELVRTLDTDVEHLRMHTRLLTKAIEWEKENYDRNLLLRGKDLAVSQEWLEQAENKQPLPTELQLDFITSSVGPLYYLRSGQGGVIKRRSAFMTGVAVSLLVGFAQLLGLFQPLTRVAYDHLLRLRPDEAQDNRFLIVKVDRSSGNDLRQKLIQGVYKPWIGGIPDQALLKVLEELDSHQPRLIGLDFYRDFPADPELPKLAEKLETMDNLVGICKATPGEIESSEILDNSVAPALRGYQPIYEIPRQDYPNRIGFNDLLDDGNLTVLRHYLVKAPDAQFCDVPSAFSLTLARRYLNSEGIEIKGPELTHNNQRIVPDSLKVGQTAVPQLRSGGRAAGLYFDSSRLLGYQALLNFRTVDGSPEEFATSVSFLDVLEGNVASELIRDRIVLIGYTDLSDNNTDSWNTPYGDMSGVLLHGQMTSQLISAALDERSLISWTSQRIGIPWILAWALVGGVIFRSSRRLVVVLGITSGGLLLLYGISSQVFIKASILIPFVSPALSMLITGSCVSYFNIRLRFQKLRAIRRKLLESSR